MNKKPLTKLQKIFKALTVVTCLTVIALTILYFYELSTGNVSYFSKHFAVGIILALVGLFAIIIPQMSSKTYSGDNKGDKAMPIVGVVIILIAIFTIIRSFW